MCIRDSLRGGVPLPDQALGLGQLAHDLLGRVPVSLHRPFLARTFTGPGTVINGGLVSGGHVTVNFRVWLVRGTTGRTITISVNSPGSETASIVPPCSCTMS